MAGDKQQPSQSQQSTLSSFFKPSQQPKRPPLASTSEILVLSDSDDDDSAELLQQQKPLAKKVKLEHNATPAQPPAQQQKLFGRVAPPSASASAPTPAAAHKRPQPSAKVLQWRYDPTAPPSSSLDPSTNGNTAQREKLARKLLGKNLLQRKTAYLQEDHYMAAANAEASGSGLKSPAFGVSGEDDEDDSFGGEDGEESDEQEVVGKGKGKATAKGKGKSAVKEQEQQLAGSRFAKFAAKGSGIAEKASAGGKTGGKVKYTPL
jgi:hypothetical protein